MILSCNCSVARTGCRVQGHWVAGSPMGAEGIKYQEKRYGVGNRVFIPTSDGPRCTCCGQIKIKK